MDYLDWLQWPAMVVTIAAAWLVGSTSKYRRNWGFWGGILSNLLWIAWGWHAHAYALILLQFGLAVMNIRGLCKSTPPEQDAEEPSQDAQSR